MKRVRLKFSYQFYLGKDDDGEPIVATEKNAAKFETYDEAERFRQEYINNHEENQEYRAAKTEVV